MNKIDMDLDTPKASISPSSVVDSNNYNGNNNNNNNNAAENNGSSTKVASTSNISTTILKSSYDTDIVRLIGQHLIDLGLKQTVDLLLEETGLSGLDHPTASRFQQHVLAAEWDEANSLLGEMAFYSDGNKKDNLNEMRFLVSRQKYLELIEDQQLFKALKCLRNEITPLIPREDNETPARLAKLLMCNTIEEVKLEAEWPGKGQESRRNLVQNIQRFVPPMIMLPPKRLSTLLSQAVQLQREKCNLHIENTDTTFVNPNTEYIDLKSDHICSPGNFPLHSKQELDNHKTEVWFCKFSNDGTKLATGGLSGKVKIWEVDPIGRNISERCTLDCNCYSITCLSWSPNDVYLLACGSEERPDLWIWNVNKEEVHNVITHSDDESTTTCSWHMSGDKFAAASTKGNFNIYDLDGNRRGSREGVRVQCLSFLYNDPDYILAADNLNRIKSYAIRDMSLETEEDDVLEEKHPIMSFTIDREDKYIAVNLLQQGIHLWNFRLRTLLRMFAGVSQRNLTVYSSFSSPNATFLASGSEDGNIYIYHLHKDQPIAVLTGHTRCVNCVSWNPRYPELLVSVSDDRIVRLWAPT